MKRSKYLDLNLLYDMLNIGILVMIYNAKSRTIHRETKQNSNVFVELVTENNNTVAYTAGSDYA